MSDTGSDRSSDTGSGTGSGTGKAGGGVQAWLVPALAFLAGAALVAVVFVVGDSGGDDDQVQLAPTPSAVPSPSPSKDALVVQVPAPCVEAARLSDDVTSALGDVATAARDFDARRLQETLDVVQKLRPQVESVSQQCLDIAADAQIVTATPTPREVSPSPVPTPTVTASVS